MANQDFLIDKRVVQRNIDRGLVDPKQLEKTIAALPDRAENATTSGYQPGARARATEVTSARAAEPATSADDEVDEDEDEDENGDEAQDEGEDEDDAESE